jgi:hypothetical protein
MFTTIAGAICGAFLGYTVILLHAATGGTLSRPADVEILWSMWMCSGMITGAIAGFSANFPSIASIANKQT